MNNNFQLPELNTWRVVNQAVTEDLVYEMVESWEINGYRFGTVCIDEGWHGKFGDWQPDPRRFQNFHRLVEWLHNKGYAVRLWIAPVQVQQGTEIFKKVYPEAILKKKNGEPALFEGLATFRLDIRQEFARDFIRGTVQKLIREYDIDAFKVDFPPVYESADPPIEELDFDLSNEEIKSMVPQFYQLIRESADAVKSNVHIECARDMANCQPYINDVICGDLIHQGRTFDVLLKIAQRLNSYTHNTSIIPWFEMIWGEESDYPTKDPAWHAGCLEFIAVSINFGLKLEHSFPPFDYPNAQQIRALNNLYGPRNKNYKVLYAGRKSFTTEQLLDLGVSIDHTTRFLVAPEDYSTAVLHTAPLKTNALQWKCRNIFTNQPVPLRMRNEYWGKSMDWCRVQFEAEKYQVYELWHEGTPSSFYRDLYQTVFT